MMIKYRTNIITIMIILCQVRIIAQRFRYAGENGGIAGQVGGGKGDGLVGYAKVRVPLACS